MRNNHLKYLKHDNVLSIWRCYFCYWNKNKHSFSSQSKFPDCRVLRRSAIVFFQALGKHRQECFGLLLPNGLGLPTENWKEEKLSQVSFRQALRGREFVSLSDLSSIYPKITKYWIPLNYPVLKTLARYNCTHDYCWLLITKTTCGPNAFSNCFCLPSSVFFSEVHITTICTELILRDRISKCPAEYFG